MSYVEIDGRTIITERDFHVALAQPLDFGPYYGYNLNALWDRLSLDVERPVKLVWLHSATSRQNLGQRFDAVVSVLTRAQEDDIRLGLSKRFEFELR